MSIEFDKDAVEKAILDTVSKDFSNVKILNVIVDSDVDFDGDEILRVQVIFDGSPRDLEPSVVTKSIRQIRPILSSFDVFAFPSMSFISAKDAKISASA